MSALNNKNIDMTSFKPDCDLELVQPVPVLKDFLILVHAEVCRVNLETGKDISIPIKVGRMVGKALPSLHCPSHHNQKAFHASLGVCTER